LKSNLTYNIGKCQIIQLQPKYTVNDEVKNNKIKSMQSKVLKLRL